MALIVGREDGSSDQCPTRFRRQQEGGGVMLWVGTVGDELVCFVRVQGVQLTSHTYCQFYKSVLEPLLEEVPLLRLRNLIYMHGNAPFHAANATTQYLESVGFMNKTMMIWPPNPPDLNPIQNLWSIVKLRVYANGKLAIFLKKCIVRSHKTSSRLQEP